VPQGIVQLKEDEFRELTQGERSVSEYVHKFTELARYAPDDVSTEAKKMARFLKGLRPELKTILASQDFLNFSHLSNKAIQVERAREEEKITSRGNSKSSKLSSKTSTRELDPLGFHPRDQASIDQLDPLRHVSASGVIAPFRPPQLQATNHQQMPVGTAETPVTSRTTAPS
jgi:phosphoenolpyruvate carboxylase